MGLTIVMNELPWISAQQFSRLLMTWLSTLRHSKICVYVHDHFLWHVFGQPQKSPRLALKQWQLFSRENLHQGPEHMYMKFLFFSTFVYLKQLFIVVSIGSFKFSLEGVHIKTEAKNRNVTKATIRVTNKMQSGTLDSLL